MPEQRDRRFDVSSTLAVSTEADVVSDAIELFEGLNGLSTFVTPIVAEDTSYTFVVTVDDGVATSTDSMNVIVRAAAGQGGSGGQGGAGAGSTSGAGGFGGDGGSGVGGDDDGEAEGSGCDCTVGPTGETPPSGWAWAGLLGFVAALRRRGTKAHR
jgi:MYXO-CTERM domain-containing protein